MSAFQINSEDAGTAMFDLARRLYPICRSITGPGVRESLTLLREIIPVDIHEVPTGTPVFDWEVPREWTIRDAYIKNEFGHRVVDFQASNLHVVNGSMPVRAQLSWNELKDRLHTLPDQPSWIPYRTCFYRDDWGFCLSYDQYQQLERRGNRPYEVCIDSSLSHGSLTYGELILAGRSDAEVLISTHICHPSLANDNLSGIAVATYLARTLATAPRRYTYRFLFLPATIGAITWLSQHEDDVSRVRHGWVLSVVGDPGSATYRNSRRGNAPIDRAFAQVLRQSGKPHTILDFEPFGYDQRQFCSPGFDLPMGCLMRTPNECYPEYHTSADNLNLIRADAMADSLHTCVAVSEILESNRAYRNLNPKCEPRLGPRGLYHAYANRPDRQLLQKAILWVLNLSDGDHQLLDIAERSNLPYSIVRDAADLLWAHELLQEVAGDALPPATAGNLERRCDEYCLL